MSIDDNMLARLPQALAFIAEIEGTVQIRGIVKGVRKVAVIADNGDEVLYNVPLVRHMTVRDGEKVVAGDPLPDGSLNPHDILRVMGEKAVQEHLLGEVQEVYMGDENYCLVQIPPGVWNGFKGVGEIEAIVCDVTDKTHAADEIERLDPHDNGVIEYDWSRKDR